MLFAAIALVMLAMFLIYVLRGPVDPLIAAGLFVSFLACLVPALYLLKPFEPPEDLRRRRTLEPSAALRARAAARKLPRLKFKLRVKDAAKHRFKITRRVRPRS